MGSKSCGSSNSAWATPDNVRPRALGMPRVARSAAASTSGVGNRWVIPACGVCRAWPYCATSLPARRIAATTVICWPSTARIASSNPSQVPGNRRPGRAATSCAIRGSCDNCALITSGTASRSNILRKRRSISGIAAGSGKSTVTSSQSPTPGSRLTQPCRPATLILRRYTPATTVSNPVIARADRNPSIAAQS